MIIVKQCAWCGADMPTNRSSKKLCKSQDHVEFHRWRQKHLKGEGPQAGFQYIEEALLNNTHPNKKHPIHNQEEQQ